LWLANFPCRFATETLAQLKTKNSKFKTLKAFKVFKAADGAQSIALRVLAKARAARVFGLRQRVAALVAATRRRDQSADTSAHSTSSSHLRDAPFPPSAFSV